MTRVLTWGLLLTLLLASRTSRAQVPDEGKHIWIGPPARFGPGTTRNSYPSMGINRFDPYVWPSLREALTQYGFCGKKIGPAGAGNIYASVLKPPGTASPPPALPAVLIVHVPADAALVIGGHATVQRGELRRFVTPPLAGGQPLAYEIEARWREGRREMRRTQVIQLAPGERSTVDFLPEEQLGPPRKLGNP